MIGDGSSSGGGRRWPAVVGVAALCGAALAVGCGSSDSGSDAGASTSTAKAVASGGTQTGAAPAKSGTDRFTIVPIGTPGGVIEVQPAGVVKDTDHFYAPGTVVTIRVRDSKSAHFAGWAGACFNSGHTCKVTVRDKGRVLVGFVEKKAGA